MIPPLQFLAAGRVAGQLIRGAAEVADRITSPPDFAGMLSDSTPSATELIDQIRGILGSLDQSVTLRADQGSLRVDGHHPAAAAIEAKLAGMSEMAAAVSHRFLDGRVVIDPA